MWIIFFKLIVTISQSDSYSAIVISFGEYYIDKKIGPQNNYYMSRQKAKIK